MCLKATSLSKLSKLYNLFLQSCQQFQSLRLHASMFLFHPIVYTGRVPQASLRDWDLSECDDVAVKAAPN